MAEAVSLVQEYTHLLRSAIHQTTHIGPQRSACGTDRAAEAPPTPPRARHVCRISINRTRDKVGAGKQYGAARRCTPLDSSFHKVLASPTTTDVEPEDLQNMADQAQSTDASQRPLHVLVVGAGIGGLTAALALRRRGHHVDVFEKSQLAQEAGAAIHLAPNANGLLKRLGLNAADHGAVECYGTREVAPDGTTRFSNDLRHINKMWQHPWHLIHRAHLHSAIKDLAIREDGEGQAVTLHVSSGVETVDPATATITLRDGSKHGGDLVVGADGVHSATRAQIPGGDLKPYDSGKSAYRFLLPRELLTADPRTAPYVTPDDYLTMCIANDRRVVLYPCVNKTMVNLVGIHPSQGTATKPESSDWQESGSKARLLEVFAAFDESILAILEKVDEQEVKIWNLLTMDKMPTFVHQKLALLGDAAHPFLPDLGQGGAQAIEDAVSLAAVLPLGTLPNELSERLAIYESCRYERSHYIQRATRLVGRDRDKIGPDDEKIDSKLSIPSLSRTVGLTVSSAKIHCIQLWP